MKLVGSVLLLVMVLASGPASAEVLAASEGPGLRHWWSRVHTDVDALIDARRLVPPTPVKLRWRARRIWSGTVPGELLDLAAADLGADGQDELLVLSGRSVLVFSRRRGLFDVRGQADLPDVPAKVRSRDSVGMLAVGTTTSDSAAETTFRARSSEQGAGASFVWRDGSVQRVSGFLLYPLCEVGGIDTAPGRNYFTGNSVVWPDGVVPALPPKLYSARCSRGMVDSTGVGVRYESDVSVDGDLRVRCEGSAVACQPAETTYAGVGYAHLVVDLDNDGYAEVVTTSAAVRGERDRLQVFAQRAGEQRLIFEREFARGILALTAGDFDGDGALELLAAERQPGAGKVKLWLLN